MLLLFEVKEADVSSICLHSMLLSTITLDRDCELVREGVNLQSRLGSIDKLDNIERFTSRIFGGDSPARMETFRLTSEGVRFLPKRFDSDCDFVRDNPERRSRSGLAELDIIDLVDEPWACQSYVSIVGRLNISFEDSLLSPDRPVAESFGDSRRSLLSPKSSDPAFTKVALLSQTECFGIEGFMIKELVEAVCSFQS